VAVEEVKFVEETPAVVEEAPAVDEEAPVVAEEVQAVEEVPAVVEQAPAVVEEAPAVVEEAPVAAEEVAPVQEAEALTEVKPLSRQGSEEAKMTVMDMEVTVVLESHKRMQRDSQSPSPAKDLLPKVHLKKEKSVEHEESEIHCFFLEAALGNAPGRL
jgi:hypothetical protein